MKHVFRNLGWLLGSRGINAVLSLVYIGLATRSLGVAGYGQFAMVVVLAQGVAGIASFNTWQAVVKWGHEEGRAGEVTGFAFALDLISIAGGLILAALACSTAAAWLPIPSGSGYLTFALCAAALMSVRSTPTGVLRLHDRYDLSTAAEATLPVTRALGAVAAWLFAPTLAGFVAAWAAAELICATIHWLVAARFIDLRLADISLRRFPKRAVRVWPFVFATSASRTSAVASKQVLLLGVGAFGGSALAGGYRVASQLGQALAQLGEAVSRAIYPDLVKRTSAANGVARRMMILAFGTGVVAALISSLAGRQAIALLAGHEFVFAYAALVLLSFAGALDLAGASWDALLVARHRAGAALTVRTVPLVAALPAMPWALSRFGLAGVAGCVLIASAVTFGGLAYLVLANRANDEASNSSIA